MKMQDDNKKTEWGYQSHLFTDELKEVLEREIFKLQDNSLVGNRNACKKHKESKLPPYTHSSKEQIEKNFNDVPDKLRGNYPNNLFKWEPTVTTGDLEKETINSQEYYKGKNSLYKFAEEWGLNSYEFDIIKRVVRCRHKGQFQEDLEKTQKLIEIYLQENK